MSPYPTNRDLAQQIEELPDKLIQRLDDRYLKLSDAQLKFDAQEKRYYTRLEGRAISAIIGLAAVLLGIWSSLKN